ncbi:Phosphatidylinositol 3- and 4-kinase family protein [Aphelenchoides avenae]|nr:Phosphatidylinositol 3- and 4-kinase family protein [Aphelenchus avenae]
MQLLQVCNLMLLDKRNLAQNDTWPAYYSKTYSVTPLGTRSGLIQWVDGATPLFQVYRKWKARQNGQSHIKVATRDRPNEAVADQQRKAKAKTPPPQEERPMDSFFRHLKAVLQAEGMIDALTDRQRWPKDALQKVLQKLISETPRDILARQVEI